MILTAVFRTKDRLEKTVTLSNVTALQRYKVEGEKGWWIYTEDEGGTMSWNDKEIIAILITGDK